MTKDTIKSPKPLSYQERLDAKKAKFEADTEAHGMRLKNNIGYITTNIPEIATQEVTKRVNEKNPAIAKILRLVGIGKQAGSTPRMTASRNSGRFLDDTGFFDTDAVVVRTSDSSVTGTSKASKWIELFEEWALPLVTTIGSRKLLSLALGGGSKLMWKGTFGMLKYLLFGRMKRRRK